MQRDAPCGQSECPFCYQVYVIGKVAPSESAAIQEKRNPATRTVPIDAIVRILNQRPLVETNLGMIKHSISTNGMRHPISVVALDDDRYGLLDGAYRLAAQRLLGAIDIECSVETDKDAARLWNLAANLCRVDLTVLDSALSLSGYVDLIRERWKDGQAAQPGGRQPHNKGF